MKSLREMLTRAVRPRVHSRFATVELSVPEFDNDLDAEDVTTIDRVGGLSVVIEYEDTKGNVSQRIVSCRNLVVRAGREYISAYCHSRKAPRSFLIERIREIYDATTGECLSPAQAFFANFEPDKTAKSGISWGLSVGRRSDLIALLNALVFIARCDKDYHPAERDSLERALTAFWLRLELAGDPDFSDILAYADKLAPDGETFWVAMHRLKEDVDLQSIFIRHANTLIQADGFVHENEAYWSVEIADFFSDQ